MAEIVLSNVSRTYPGGVVGVRGLDMTARDGELLVLVGPSGSGKTTTLRLIAGLESPDDGEIRLGGQLLNGAPPAARDVALVSQHAALYPHLSVRDNLGFALKLRSQGSGVWRFWNRLTKSAEAAKAATGIDQAVAEVAKMLGLEGLLDRRPSALSGGEQQRVALGRALVRRPQAWLLDEPLAHLDAPLRADLRRELRRLQRQLGATMIYVTHDSAEALLMGDRVAVMREGELQQVGPWRDLYDRPATRFVAEFVAPLPLGVVTGVLSASTSSGPPEGQLIGSGWSIPVDNRACDGVQQRFGKRLAMGIRPEDVWLGGGVPPWPSACRLEARIDLVEPRGDCSLVWLRPDSTSPDGGVASGLPDQAAECLVSKAEASGNYQTGDRVEVHVNLSRAHWFDADTGRNIRGRCG